MNIHLITTSIILAIGMAMDAASVSMVNGLREPKLKKNKAFLIALSFGVFQFGMYIIGYFLGHSILSYIEKVIPWLSLGILCFLGGKMLVEGIKETVDNRKVKEVSEEELKAVYRLKPITLIIQAVATSIDALTVGFTSAEYIVSDALFTGTMIGVITLAISFLSVYIGKKFGLVLKDKAVMLGGIILIAVGFIIFFS